MGRSFWEESQWDSYSMKFKLMDSVTASEITLGRELGKENYKTPSIGFSSTAA